MLDAAREVVREKNVVVNTKVSLKRAIDALDGALVAMKQGRQRLASVEEEVYHLIGGRPSMRDAETNTHQRSVEVVHSAGSAGVPTPTASPIDNLSLGGSVFTAESPNTEMAISGEIERMTAELYALRQTIGRERTASEVALVGTPIRQVPQPTLGITATPKVDTTQGSTVRRVATYADAVSVVVSQQPKKAPTPTQQRREQRKRQRQRQQQQQQQEPQQRRELQQEKRPQKERKRPQEQQQQQPQKEKRAEQRQKTPPDKTVGGADGDGWQQQRRRPRRGAAQKSEPAREPRRRPRGEVIIIPAKTEGYAAVVKKMKEAAAGKEGLIKGIRKTRGGDVLIQLRKGADPATSSANTLHEVLAQKGLVTRRPVDVDTLLIRGIDVTSSREDVSAALEARGRSSGEEPRARIVALHETPEGTLTARVEVTQKFASLILRTGAPPLRIGWCNTKVRRYVTVERCFRCLGYGHRSKECRSQIDRSQACFRCGDGGHRAKECKMPERCLACADRKQPHTHRTGTANCPAFQDQLRRAVPKGRPSRR